MAFQLRGFALELALIVVSTALAVSRMPRLVEILDSLPVDDCPCAVLLWDALGWIIVVVAWLTTLMVSALRPPRPGKNMLVTISSISLLASCIIMIALLAGALGSF